MAAAIYDQSVFGFDGVGGDPLDQIAVNQNIGVFHALASDAVKNLDVGQQDAVRWCLSRGACAGDSEDGERLEPDRFHKACSLVR